MARKRKGSRIGRPSRPRESTQDRMEKAAKALFETPPLEDQEEWEAELLEKLKKQEE